MMLTTKGRYAIMAMLEMAISGKNRPMKIDDIGLSQNIPSSYLEQIFAKLKAASVVISCRGPGGGYLLSAPPDQIYLDKIIDAVEENISIVRCKDDEQGCMPSGAKCHTHELWEALGNNIEAFFASFSLEDVLLKKIKPKGRDR
jgi:Rrf2 family iron-sulfur cluster assembly transcriptional regulator